MWGAGGAGTGIGNMANLNLDTAMLYPGGSGAYVSCAIDAPNGVNLYLLVGQGGRVAGYGSSTTTAIGGGGMMSYKQIDYAHISFHMMFVLSL